MNGKLIIPIAALTALAVGSVEAQNSGQVGTGTAGTPGFTMPGAVNPFPGTGFNGGFVNPNAGFLGQSGAGFGNGFNGQFNNGQFNNGFNGANGFNGQFNNGFGNGFNSQFDNGFNGQFNNGQFNNGFNNGFNGQFGNGQFGNGQFNNGFFDPSLGGFAGNSGFYPGFASGGFGGYPYGGGIGNFGSNGWDQGYDRGMNDRGMRGGGAGRSMGVPILGVNTPAAALSGRSYPGQRTLVDVTPKTPEDFARLRLVPDAPRAQ